MLLVCISSWGRKVTLYVPSPGNLRVSLVRAVSRVEGNTVIWPGECYNTLKSRAQENSKSKGVKSTRLNVKTTGRDTVFPACKGSAHQRQSVNEGEKFNHFCGRV